MSVTTSNLIMGAGQLYIGAVGAGEPVDTSVNSAPASGTWTNVGATLDGVDISISREFADLEADQLKYKAGARLSGESIMVSTNLAEPTLDLLYDILNGVGTEASGSGYQSLEPDHDEFVPTFYAVMFDGFAPGSGNTRRVILRRALQKSDVSFAYKKDDQTVYTVEFEAYYVAPGTQPWKIIDGTR